MNIIGLLANSFEYYTIIKFSARKDELVWLYMFLTAAAVAWGA